jgi:hypothetical protein
MLRQVAATFAFLLLSMLLAGCSDGGGDGDGATGTTSAPTPDPCPSVTDTSTVPTWTKHGGQWGDVVSQEGHATVVCGKATSALNSLVNDLSGPYGDLEALVSFNMLAGDFGVDQAAETTHAGAGIVVHFADDRNYNIVRYSPREHDWHLFTMIDGTRKKENDATVEGGTDPDYKQWVTLKVRSEGGHVTAFDGATKVIDFQLPEGASANGRVGYFLRDAGMSALYDDFSVTAL